jgi:kynurenine formamidase
MSSPILAHLVSDLVAGRIRVVDLTHTLAPEFPPIVLPPEFGESAPVRIEEVSRYDARGRDLPNNATDTILLDRFIASASVIDCSREAAEDADYLLTVAKLRAFEERHGRILPRSWVLMRTDWSKRSNDPVAFQNFDETGQHTPGPDVEAVRFLVEERDVLGFGTETIGTDAGQGAHLRPPYPCHALMHGAGRFGLQCLTNLDLLPPSGAVLIAAPLKIRQGSGSPLRVLALVAA